MTNDEYRLLIDRTLKEVLGLLRRSSSESREVSDALLEEKVGNILNEASVKLVDENENT